MSGQHNRSDTNNRERSERKREKDGQTGRETVRERQQEARTLFWLMDVVFLWSWNRELPYLTPMENEQEVSVQIESRYFCSHWLTSITCTGPQLENMTCDWKSSPYCLGSNVSPQFKLWCAWHGTAGGSDYGCLSLSTLSFLWKKKKKRLLLWKRRFVFSVCSCWDNS